MIYSKVLFLFLFLFLFCFVLFCCFLVLVFFLFLVSVFLFWVLVCFALGFVFVCLVFIYTSCAVVTSSISIHIKNTIVTFMFCPLFLKSTNSRWMNVSFRNRALYNQLIFSESLHYVTFPPFWRWWFEFIIKGNSENKSHLDKIPGKHFQIQPL